MKQWVQRKYYQRLDLLLLIKIDVYLKILIDIRKITVELIVVNNADKVLGMFAPRT